MNTVPPLVPPSATPPPAPEAPKPVSRLKIAIWSAVGVLAAAGTTLLAWEQGRVDLFAWLDVRGARRQQADLLVRGHQASNAAQLFELYKYDADRKDPLALWEVGNRYQAGDGVGQNDRRARESWEAAAATGDAVCQMRLAEKFERGDRRTIAVDLPRTAELLRMAASQGEDTAQDRLAEFLLRVARGADGDVIAFADILSEDQQNQIRGLESLSAAVSPPAGLSAAERLSRKRTAIAEVAKLVRVKLQSEAYLWLAILAVDSGSDDVRRRRDSLNGQLSQDELSLAQEAVDRWSAIASPGTKVSPFAKLDGQPMQLPADGKQQTLGEMLKALAKESGEPAPALVVPEVAKAVPAPAPVAQSADANPAPRPASSGYGFEPTVAFISELRMIQVGAAVQRNAMLSASYTVNGRTDGQVNWSFQAIGLSKAAGRLRAAAKAISAREAAAPRDVHASAREYGRALSQALERRADCFDVCASCSQDIFAGKIAAAAFGTTMKLEMDKQEQFVKQADDAEKAMESALREAFGKASGVAPAEASYKSMVESNDLRLRRAIDAMDASKIYSLVTGIKYNGWTFEFGEMREVRVGLPEISGGVARFPVQFSVVGNSSGNVRTFSLTLVLSLEGNNVVLLNLY